MANTGAVRIGFAIFILIGCIVNFVLRKHIETNIKAPHPTEIDRKEATQRNNNATVAMNVTLLHRDEKQLDIKPTEKSRATAMLKNKATQRNADTFEGYTFPVPDCNIRLLIYECSGKDACRGLADRQRGMISTFLLALLTNRTFGIIYTKPCPLSNVFVPNAYDWSKCLSSYNLTTDIHSVHDFYSPKIKNNMPMLSSLPKGDIWKQKTVVIRTNKFMRDIISQHASVNDTIPWLLRYSKTRVWHKLHHVLFKLKTSFRYDIDKFIDRTTRNGSLILVGVHIRYQFITKSDLVGIFNFIDQFTDTSKYVIYISTDSTEVRQQTLKRFTGCVSVNVTGVTLNVESRHATCQSLYLAAFEQQVLSRSDVIFKTYSGFSWMSFVIRGNHGQAYQYGLQRRDLGYQGQLEVKPMKWT